MTFDKDEFSLLVDILSDHWQRLNPDDNLDYYERVRKLQDRVFAESKNA